MGRCKATTTSGRRCKNTPVEGSEYCHIESHQPDDGFDLQPKQRRFCQLFVSEEFYGNGVRSYLEAYNLNSDKQYNTAKVEASKLLTKPNICNYINHLLDEAGLNDQFVDKQLLKLITQDADFSNKLGAIKEYNKLQDRITDHLSVDGEMDMNLNITIAPASETG